MHVLTSFMEYEVVPDRFWGVNDEQGDFEEQVARSTSLEWLLHRGEGTALLEQSSVGSALATWSAMREIMSVDAWMAY
jgi:hypothetical protein